MPNKIKHIKELFLEKILRYYTVVVFVCLPLLYFPGRAASYVTAKQYFFIGTVDVLFILWIWLLLRDARYRLTKKSIFLLLPFLLFLLSLTVSAVVGVDPRTSFFSVVESGTGLLLMYHVFVFSLIIASLVRVQQKKVLISIGNAIFFSSTILAIMTFFTGPNGLFDIHSEMLNKSSGGATMGNSLLVGAFFIFSVFLTILLIVKEKKRGKQIMYLIGIALIVFSPIYFNVALFKGTTISSSYLLFGQARIASSALIVGLAVSLFLWLFLRNTKVSKTVSVIGIVLLCISGGVVVYTIASSHSQLHSFFVKESGNRIIDWQESIKGIKEKPVFGWGPENFHVVYQHYLDPVVFSPGHGNEVWSWHPHNATLEILVNGGVVAGIFYLAILVGIGIGCIQAYKRHLIDKKTIAIITGMVIAFIIQQQMIYDSIVSIVVFFSGIAVLAGLLDGTDKKEVVYSKYTVATRSIGVAVVIIMIPVWIYGAYMPARKTEELQRVALAHSNERGLLYEHLFHSSGSYAINTDPAFYVDSFFYSYNSQREVLKDNPVYKDVASKEIQLLIDATDPLWQKNTVDYKLSLTLVNMENLLFYFTGNSTALQHATVYAQRALTLSPTDPQIYTAYAQTLVYEKDTDGAKALLEKALALNSNYQPAVAFKKIL